MLFDDSTQSVSFTNTAGNLLVVGLTHDYAMSVTAFTYNGVSLTEAVTQDDAGVVPDHAAIWYLVNPATGTNTLSITMDDSDDTGMAVASFSGVSTSSPLDATNTALDATSPISISATTTATNELVIAVCGDDDDAANTRTPQGNTIEIIDAIHGSGAGDYGGFLGYQIATSTGSYSISYANSNLSEGNQVIATFKEATGGGGPAPSTAGWKTLLGTGQG